MQQLKISMVAFATTVLFSSCLKETIDELSTIKGVKANPQFSVPLVNASIGIKEVYETYAKSALITEKPDGQIVFAYEGSDKVGGASFGPQFISIPAIPIDISLQMNPLVIAAFEAQNGFNLSVADTVQIPTSNNESLKNIGIKTGQFRLTINNTFQHNTDIVIRYPGIRKNGVPLEVNANLVYSGGGSTSFFQQVDLAGYEIDLRGANNAGNAMAFEYQIAMVRNPANPTTVANQLSINQQIQIGSYAYLTGYLGKFELIKTSEAEQLDVFAQKSGDLFFKDPRLVIKVVNSFGIPVTGRIKNLRVTTKEGSDLAVVIDAFKDTFTLATPANLGEVAISQYPINNTNSNIDDVINSTPTYIKYDLEFFANFNEIPADNFIADTSSFTVFTSTELPLDVKLENFFIEQRNKKSSTDTSVTDVYEVERAGLTVEISNSLPFDVELQVVFLYDSIAPDSSVITSVVDSLFNEPVIIRGGIVNADGDVTAPAIASIKAEVNKFKYNRIRASNRYIARAEANSSIFNGNRAFVKVKTDQKLDIKVGADAKLIFKP
ncbi:MAG: hypothetical protein MUE96_12370 [Bacteroidia bacterium]|jgi:hypothetical protein|nr:hypothetical protein [Bacteroidia bacterium]